MSTILNINISGSGTREEIASSLQCILEDLKNPTCPTEATWEDATLLTELTEKTEDEDEN